MANFDQNVTINLDVDTDGVQSGLTAAVSEIQGAQKAAEGLDDSFVRAASGMDTFSEVAEEVSDTKISPEFDTEGIGDEVENLERLADSLETVSEVKDEVAESNEVLSQKNEQTGDSTESEAKSFETLMESASSLSDAKDAVANSNSVLDDQNKKTKRSILKEAVSADVLEESGLNLQEMLDGLTGKQEEVGAQSRKSAMGIDEETRSFEEMLDSADDLEGAKHAVSNANQRLQNESGKSNRELLEEKVAADELDEKVLGLADSKRRLSNDSNAASRGMRRMRKEADDATDSMRAAAEVGDIFEDGLGSLSVNMGAFTIALRNFLTQVPLLLTALGALGAAALGAASAIGVLAGALGGVIIGGLIAHLQNLKSEFEGIETLGEALEVVMKNLRDLFLRAVEPLVEIEGASGIFAQVVTGVARATNAVSKLIAKLFTGTQKLEEMAGGADELVTIQEFINNIEGDAFIEILDALAFAWARLGKETESALEAIGEGTADAIRRSAELLDSVEDLSDSMGQFGDTISELAELGFKIGGGLLPVFRSFSVIVENVASSLNDMDGQVAQNVITFLALFAAINKVSGVLGSIVTVLPSVAGGLGAISTQAAAASGSIGSLKAVMSGAATQFGGFLHQISALGGMSKLVNSANDASGAFSRMSGSAKTSAGALDDLSQVGDMSIDPNLKGLEESNNLLRRTSNRMIGLEGNTNTVSGAFTKLRSATRALVGDIWKVVKAQFAFAGAMVKAGASALAAAGRIALLTLKTLYATGSFTMAGKALWNMVTANLAAAGAAVTNAASMALSAAMTFLFGSSATVATASVWSLISSIVVLTGGLFLLVAALGGLAVGIITNFEEIKSAASDTFGFLKDIIGIVVDVLLTVFVESWNVIVALFQAVIGGVSPLIDIFTDLAEQLGLMGGSAEDGGGSLGMLGSIANFVTGYVEYLSDGLQVMTAILGAVIAVVSTVIRIALTPLIAAISLVISYVEFLIDLWGMLLDKLIKSMGGDGLGSVISSIKEFVSGVRDSMETIPGTIEEVINDVIGLVNDFLETINSSGVIDVGTIDDVDITGDSAQTDRDELAADTEGAEEGAAEEGDKKVEYNEDNSTNIDQTVDADPEDQAQLSRVVTDAINEANSFDRRRQGGQ